MSRRLFSIVVLLALVGGLAWYFKGAGQPDSGAGGRLVASQRTEPNSFNRLASPTSPVELIARLTSATLVRVNRVSGALEPALATDWSTSADGLTFTLKLRSGVTFSDGTPFTSADVVFSFRALYDPRVASAVASGMMVNDQPLIVSAIDDHTVVVTFPAPYGPGLSILDSLPILPRHKLEAALNNGTFAAAWGVTSPLADVVGLGPFVIAEYQPGQRMRFTRNARYWGRDAQGVALPYLDELVLEFIPDQNAEMLQLEAGTLDLITEQIRAEDFASLERAAAAKKVQLVEAGVSVDPTGFWFNLKAGSASAKARPWLQREELRHAISFAVNRQKVVDTVFLGAAEPAYGPITRGYGPWYLPTLPHPDFDQARAKALLASIGLKDRNGDGTLDEPNGKPARFAVITRKGNTLLERTLANVQEQLAQIGLGLDIVALEGGELINRIVGGDYEAAYYGAPVNSIDPAINSDMWLSSGGFHLWNPAQERPATPWEQQIDVLMRTQATTMDKAKRVEIFADVQRVFAEHEPIIYFAAPKVTVAMSARVTGAVPAVVQPQILWKPETLAVTGPAIK
jgi:peptide/nickel transport system substrate-binding protein